MAIKKLVIPDFLLAEVKSTASKFVAVAKTSNNKGWFTMYNISTKELSKAHVDNCTFGDDTTFEYDGKTYDGKFITFKQSKITLP